MKTKNYKSVALSEEAYKELLEVSKHENRPIGRELAGLIKMKYIFLFYPEELREAHLDVSSKKRVN
mgnify:CR=1 FL=1|tara:strand:+ start:259 stop:456 length:198 start_codon:yes stop_codon:yes gene_type:complete